MKTKTLILAFLIAISLPASVVARGHWGWHMNQQQYQNSAMQGNVNCPKFYGNTQSQGQMQPGMGRRANIQGNINCPRLSADSQPADQMQPGMGRRANMQRNINCPYATLQQSGDTQ